ncbi:MAG TPA: ATPase domain-containing protein, partial [Pseudomonadales bacterium]
ALEIIWCPPLEGRIDAMAYKLLEAARRRRVSRLLVDGMEAFGQSALQPERLGRFFTALAGELRNAGVTTLYTLEVPSGSDPAERLAPVSAIAQYLLVLRFAELGADVRRTVTIRKSRRSAFDPRIRAFRIGERGITIGDAVGA